MMIVNKATKCSYISIYNELLQNDEQLHQELFIVLILTKYTIYALII